MPYDMNWQTPGGMPQGGWTWGWLMSLPPEQRQMAMAWALSQQKYGLAQERLAIPGAGGGGAGISGDSYGLGRQQLALQAGKFAWQRQQAQKEFGLRQRQAFPLDYAAKHYGQWFPELYSLMQGRLQAGRRDIMNQITGNLGRTMGAHLSRTNVPVPVGTDVLARRYLSPLSQSMEMADPARLMGQSFGLAQQFAPMFGQVWGQKSPLEQRSTDLSRYLNRYMGRYWGGGR